MTASLPNTLTPTLYGIPNCDSVKRARQQLAQRWTDYVFVDFKKNPPTPDMLQRWISAGGVSWNTLLNRQGTTWRRLDPAIQATVVDQATAIALMCAHPSLIKRPVIVWETGRSPRLTVGLEAAAVHWGSNSAA